jgi:endonuclease/exonuclease/phosphatase family metal-dependent hydrolase
MMTSPTAELSDTNQQLVAQLKRFATFEQLRRSEFFRVQKPAITQLLNAPRIYSCPNAGPRLRSFLRVVEWNIERGSRFEGIINVLNEHPILRFADLVLLNELDDGMIRSANRDVAADLSLALQAHAVFGVEYLELTKGAGAEANLSGDNTKALHGNAIMTRYPLYDPEIVRLPRCENNFESKERRIGGRIGIFLDVEINGRKIAIGNTHLDVVGTPRCRGNQMSAMLKHLENRVAANTPVIVGGDLNTHTFARGTTLRTIRNTATILGGDQKRLRSRLGSPEIREPAIQEFARFGYQTEGFNDRKATSRTIVSNLDDTAKLPGPIRWWVRHRIPPEGVLLEFRLDWLAARGLRALRAGEVVDRETGAVSISAQTFAGLTYKGETLSDHDPIAFDVSLD